MIASLTPSGKAAPLPRMALAQTAMELRLLVRNGEQLLLTIAIPTLLLVLFSAAPLVDVEGTRVGFLTPGILALAVMSTAFTGQAIATGYDRRYGALKLLGATPLPRWVLLAAKTAAVLAIEVLQAALLVGVAYALAWSPHGSATTVLSLVGLALLATAAFSGLGLLMAGTLRAETTLALANLVYVLLLVTGGVVFPLTKFPGGVEAVLQYSPTAALADGLRAVLEHGASVPAHDVVALAVWALVALGAAARTFRWE